MEALRKQDIQEIADKISKLFYDRVDRDLPLLEYGSKEYVSDYVHQMGDTFIHISYKAMAAMIRTHNEEIFNGESKEYLYVDKYFNFSEYTTSQILQFIKESKQWDILERAISNEDVLFKKYAYLMNVPIEDATYIINLMLKCIETMQVW